MKRSVDLDDELMAEVDRAASLIHEKPATIIRLAIRAGLPVVTGRFQGLAVEGALADDYRDWPKDRIEFENAMGKTKQRPER